MANQYEVGIYKTFHGYVYVEAESMEEARTIAYALSDNDDCDDLEYCDDENRLECDLIEDYLPHGYYYSREDVADEDFEFAKQCIEEWKEYWARREKQYKKIGVEEYQESLKSAQ